MTARNDIGPLVTAAPQDATGRRRPGRVVVPETGEIREVELFDATPALNRRQEVASPSTASMRFLRFARLLLDAGGAGYAPLSVGLAGDEEAVLYVNRGEARVTVGSEAYALGQGDLIYLGLGEEASVETDGVADLSEFRASDCHTKYPVQLVRLTDIEGTPLAARLGTDANKTARTVYKLVDLNVQACRLLFGHTVMAGPGSIGSYPPHFHGPDGPEGLGDAAKEELYHFRVASRIPGDVPFVLQNVSRPGERVNAYVHVFDEQAINVTPSFHDTIAPPAVSFAFSWCLASYTEGQRDWAAVLKRPGYEQEQ